MKNLEIVKILRNIADILELQGIEFKPQAYRNAARGIESLTEDIERTYYQGRLEKIPGVGKHIAEKITEIIETGKLQYYQKLKKKIKIDLESLKQIPSLGPKRIMVLYKKLGIKTVRDLEKAIRTHKVSQLKGFGHEIEKELKQGIDFFKNKPNRSLYAHAASLVIEIITYLDKFSFVQKIEPAGSFRRGRETVGDLDFLVVSKQPGEVIKAFISMPDIKKVISKGKTKSSVRFENGLQADLRVVPEKVYGSATLYFIGSKQHNIELRKIALKKGYSLSEYGLFKIGKDRKKKRLIASKTEKDIYTKLGMSYIAPELRENTGEIEAAKINKLPKLITPKQINGLFHNHSTWSDGLNTISEMVQKVESLKMKFISFNDHQGSLKIANALDEKRLTKYVQAINKVQKKSKIKIFTGVEADILKGGNLSLSKKWCKKLDVVIASVHSSSQPNEKKLTKCVTEVLENYPINILGHPTGRKLNERAPHPLNLEKIYTTAKDNNVFLEINASRNRMDLSGDNIKSALEYGCKFALGTDAHQLSQIENYHLGILNLRRGWAEKKDILNCWRLDKIEKSIKK